jgi:hypothetical protein
MATNNVIIPTNEILEAGAYYRNRLTPSSTMKTLITQNILADYMSKGIRDAQVSCFFSNYKSENGLNQKNWREGNFLVVGDVIQINGKNEVSNFMENNTPIPFRIVSRQVQYEGSPKIVLKCQEIKVDTNETRYRRG